MYLVMYTGPLLDVEGSVFSPRLARSRCPVIGVWNCRIILEFDGRLRSHAAELPVRVRIDPTVLCIDPGTSRLRGIGGGGGFLTY